MKKSKRKMFLKNILDLVLQVREAQGEEEDQVLSIISRNTSLSQKNLVQTISKVLKININELFQLLKSER